MANKHPTNGFDKHPENINRKGRPPKGQTITEAIKEILEREPPETPGRIYKLIFAEAMVKSAITGNPAAMRLLMNYCDGMPVQKQILSTEDDEPFVIEIKESK